MLTLKKNPVIDEPLVVAPVLVFRRVRRTFWILLGFIGVSLAIGLALFSHIGQDMVTENWWRRLITQVSHWQFQQHLITGRDNELSKQIKVLEAERLEMQTTIQKLEKLVQGTRMDGWLRTFSATRINEGDIGYEILIANPRPKSETPRGHILVTVRGIDRFDPQNPEVALAQSTLRFRTVQHKIQAPEMAEAIKGRLSSKASNFVIVTVIPFDDPALTEVSVIPIAIAQRSP